MSVDAGRLLALLSIPEVTTTYWGIQQLQPMQLSQWLEREGVNPHGNILELRGRLLRLFVRRSHPEAKVPWYLEDDLPNVKTTESQNSQCNEKPKDLALPAPINVERKEPVKTSTNNVEIMKTVETDRVRSSPEDLFEYRLNCIKILKLWNIKFSGEKGRPAKEFIDDIKDFQKFTKVSDQMLLDMLSCVMAGQAKAWYRSIKLNSWKAFVEAFYQTFIFFPDQQMSHRINFTS